MDPNQLNDGSQGGFSGGNMPSYHWNPYMYGYQVPQSWFPQGLPQFPPNVPMMQPGSNSPQLFDSAENLAASTQINEEDVDQHLVSAAETSKGRRSKGSNFSPKEDVNLVKSWLEISCDPITSTGQKKGWHVVKDSAAIQLEEGSVPRKECEISTEPLGHYQG